MPTPEFPWAEVKRVDDNAESVTKFVFTNPSAVAEAVLYRYPTYATRTVICISTQSGCPVGCRFCGAGDNFVRSLTADEIVAQAVYCLGAAYAAEEVQPSDMGRLQIMFMSMGEPLLNLKALDPAIRRLHQLYPKAALLISTIGPDIGEEAYESLNQLCEDVPTVGLQFSVHESTDAARAELIPFKRKLSLEQIAMEGQIWFARTGRRPFFNYCANDHNSGAADADRLLAHFSPAVWNATVSVVCERNEGMPATNDHQRELAMEFAAKLVDRAYDTRVFDPAGQDTIGGGCGQLWFVQNWMNQHPELAKPSVGAGRRKVHAPAAAYPQDGGLKAPVRAFEDTLSMHRVLSDAIAQQRHGHDQVAFEGAR
jgi:23S rRNA (adenine2503-C2)-methyltransferase